MFLSGGRSLLCVFRAYFVCVRGWAASATPGLIYVSAPRTPGLIYVSVLVLVSQFESE